MRSNFTAFLRSICRACAIALAVVSATAVAAAPNTLASDTLASVSQAGLQAPVSSAGGEPIDLTFSGFFVRPTGPHGLQIADTLRAADGRQVRLIGYMVAQERPIAGRFMLTARPVRMSEHADGEADDLPPATVTVLLDEAQQDRVVAHQPGPILLSGRLTVGRVEDASGRVSWVQLHLEPDAVAVTRLGSPSHKHLPAPTSAR